MRLYVMLQAGLKRLLDGWDCNVWFSFIPKMGRRHDSRQIVLELYCIGFHYSYLIFSQHSLSHTLYGCVMYIMYMTHIDLPWSAGRSTPNF